VIVRNTRPPRDPDEDEDEDEDDEDDNEDEDEQQVDRADDPPLVREPGLGLA
jgi:hypothetical protein